VVSTYQSTSGGGKAAMDELFNQTRGIFMNQPWRDHQEKFPKQIAFNAIPHIDVFMDDGATKEEWKMNVETRKILDPKIKVHANCARIPSFIGHAEYINIETDNPIDAEAARAVLRGAKGVSVVDFRQDEGYVTPAECAGEDAVFVSRIRDDATVDNGLSFWCVSDNLRKGAALNTVQIAEVLCRDYLDA
jgi:aspartate-semialdehyde dehydrogenase